MVNNSQKLAVRKSNKKKKIQIKLFLNFLLHRNSQKAAIGAGVKDKFSTLETEQDGILELVVM